MVNFENGIIPINDVNLNKMQTDLQGADNNLQEQIDNINIYSTEEQIVGKWIDGKPLYRKVIVLPNGTGTTDEKIYNLSDFGISNTDSIHIVHPSYYTLKGADNITDFEYPFAYNDGNAFTLAVTTSGKLLIKLEYDQICNSKVVITLEYTKRTD